MQILFINFSDSKYINKNNKTSFKAATVQFAVKQIPKINPITKWNASKDNTIHPLEKEENYFVGINRD